MKLFLVTLEVRIRAHDVYEKHLIREVSEAAAVDKALLGTEPGDSEDPAGDDKDYSLVSCVEIAPEDEAVLEKYLPAY